MGMRGLYCKELCARGTGLVLFFRPFYGACDFLSESIQWSDIDELEELLMSAHLKTLSSLALAQQLGVETVVMNAPTRTLESAQLVVSLSEAGGLGVICAIGMTPQALEQRVNEVRSLTDRPFAIALAIPSRARALPEAYEDAVLESLIPVGEALELDLKAIYEEAPSEEAAFEALFDCALSLGPKAMISCFGGFREPHAERLEAAQVLNIGVVTSLREAKVLRFAGCDALIVQGIEAGGPSMAFESETYERMGLVSLITQCSLVKDFPLIAWGGVTTPTELEALRVLGVSGVALEGPFLMSEAVSLPSPTRYLLQSGGLEHTCEVRGLYGVPTRVLRTAFTENLPTEALTTPLSYRLKRVFWAINDRARSRGDSVCSAVEIGHEIGVLRKKLCMKSIQSSLKNY